MGYRNCGHRGTGGGAVFKERTQFEAPAEMLCDLVTVRGGKLVGTRMPLSVAKATANRMNSLRLSGSWVMWVPARRCIKPR